MKAQAASSHTFLWTIVLFVVLVVAMIAMLSRSAADGPAQPPVENGANNAVGTAPAP